MLISFVEVGSIILIPIGYAKTFGQKNIVLIYGLIAILSVNRILYALNINSIKILFLDSDFYMLITPNFSSRNLSRLL